MHGIGVDRPIAAEVAEATSGLAMLMRISDGMMFSIGTKSIIVAVGYS